MPHSFINLKIAKALDPSVAQSFLVRTQSYARKLVTG
jgi:hypothetical protein